MKRSHFKCIIILAVVALVSCSKSNDAKTSEPAVEKLECSRTNGLLSSDECALIERVDSSDEFYSETRKFKKVGESFYFLNTVVNANWTAIDSSKALNDVFAYERGMIRVMSQNKTTWVFSDPLYDIADMDVNDRGEVIAIASDNSTSPHTKVRILFFSKEGELLKNISLQDPDQNQDVCENGQMVYIFGDCNEVDYKTQPDLVFMKMISQRYSVAKIAWAKSEGQFYTLIDKGIRENTVLYRWKVLEDSAQLIWKLPVLHGTKTALGIPFGLTGGSERHALNRYAYGYEKPLVVDDKGDLYFGLNIFFNPLARLAPFLTDEQEKALDRRWSALVVKVSSQGAFVWSAVASTQTSEDRPLTALAVHDGVVDVLTHKFGDADPNERYKVVITRLSAKQGSVFVPATALAIPGNSFAFGLTSFNKDEVLVSGLTAFSQNPNGMSLGNYGKAFLAKYNMTSEKINIFSYRESLRKDVARVQIIEKNSVYSAVDRNGPITHSADTDVMQAQQRSALRVWDHRKIFP